MRLVRTLGGRYLRIQTKALADRALTSAGLCGIWCVVCMSGQWPGYGGELYCQTEPSVKPMALPR